jgi:serine protease Do
VLRGFIGVALQELPPSQIDKLNLAETGAVLVKQVIAGEAAHKAGLAEGDIIVRFAGKKLGASQPLKSLRQRIVNTKPGKTVEIEIVRDGKHLTKTITVGRRPTLP